MKRSIHRVPRASAGGTSVPACGYSQTRQPPSRGPSPALKIIGV
jgi:hypothetical protein